MFPRGLPAPNKRDHERERRHNTARSSLLVARADKFAGKKITSFLTFLRVADASFVAVDVFLIFSHGGSSDHLCA